MFAVHILSGNEQFSPQLGLLLLSQLLLGLLLLALLLLLASALFLHTLAR